MEDPSTVLAEDGVVTAEVSNPVRNIIRQALSAVRSGASQGDSNVGGDSHYYYTDSPSYEHHIDN